MHKTIGIFHKILIAVLISSTITFAVLSLLLFAYFANSLHEKQIAQRQMQIEAQRNNPGFPVRLFIPSINVDASVDYVGLTSQGAMDVPSNISDVAWFAFGPRPGQMGNAVIAGHLDGKNGEEAVFANLYQLKQGDKLYIEDDKGKSIVFIVSKIRLFDPKNPEDVFAKTGTAHLNLVTCEGVFDNQTKSYSKRLVVFADVVH